jgi:hypothetical protein
VIIRYGHFTVAVYVTEKTPKASTGVIHAELQSASYFYLFLNLFALVRELIMLGPGSNAWLLVATATVTFLILFAAAFAPV